MRYIYVDDVSYQNKFDLKTGNTIKFPEKQYRNVENIHIQIDKLPK